MANYVYNRVDVFSGDPRDITEFYDYIQTEPAIFKAQTTNEDKRGHEFHGFSFHSFITLDVEHAEEYYAKNGSGPDGSYGDTEFNWYNFNTREWNTKWDATDVDINRSLTSINISFQTAWEAPTPIWQAMTDKFPHLRFAIWWEEEQGFGAELTAENGVVTLQKEWDIPDSHQDYVDQDKADGCICTYYNDPDDWYDDCPRDDEQTTYVIETITKRYIKAYTLLEAMQAAEAEEAGNDLPRNTEVIDVIYADRYQQAAPEDKEEETNE